MEDRFHDIACVYLGQQDLSSLTPEEMCGKYFDVYTRIKNEYKSKQSPRKPSERKVISTGVSQDDF